MKKKRTTNKKSLVRAEALPKRQFPAHLNTTPEEWRALKRTEWREVMQALHRFYLGCAFTPSQPALHRVNVAADQVSEALEAEGWIAW